jgi:hypothetical protein
MRISLFGKKLGIKTSFTLIFITIVLTLVTFSGLTALAKYNILKIDIDVEKNPLNCGEETSVTVTIHLEDGDDIPGYGDLRVGLIEDDGPNATVLDKDSLWIPGLMEGENIVSFTVKCQLKEAGCQLWGPRGNSDESGAWVFAYIWSLGEKSPKVYIQCKQTETNGEVSINGSDSCIVGDETNVVMSAVEPIENVTFAFWNISYDSSIFKIETVEFLNPLLIDYAYRGFVAYQDIPSENKISFSFFSIERPLTLDGELVNIGISAKTDTPKFWQETFLKCTDDSVFFDELDKNIEICTGGNHSIFILPSDKTSPNIDNTLIDFSQGFIIGKPGAVIDENYGFLDDYLTVSLYNEDDELVSEEKVNPDGSFELGPFFWLSSESKSTLVVTNALSLNTSYSFTPLQSSIPYVYALNDTTGSPAEDATVQFYLQGRSDVSEIYDVSISDAQGWEFEQKSFQFTLGPMDEKTLQVNTSIPESADNGTINTITLTMISTTKTEFSDSDSLNIKVIGEYEEPTEPSDKDSDTEDETPGFEFVIFCFAILIIGYVIFRKKTR